MIWDRETGAPIHNAIVWQDTRTAALVRELAGEAGVDRLREQVGLPLSTYFSGPKVTWMLDARRRRRGRARGRRAGVRHDRRMAAVEPDRRRPRDRRVEREPHAPDGSAHARVASAGARADGHPAGADAGDPLVERALRRDRGGCGRRLRRRRDPRRPAGRALRADAASRAARRRTPTAPARSCSSTPAPRSSTRARC